MSVTRLAPSPPTGGTDPTATGEGLMSARIGVCGIFIECNHFTVQLADRATFERSEWLYGGELLAKDTGVLGGMMSVLRANDSEPVPLLYASACPSGVVRAEVYDALKNELLEWLDNAGELDGISPLPAWRRGGSQRARHGGRLGTCDSRTGGRRDADRRHARPARAHHARVVGQHRCIAGVGNLSARRCLRDRRARRPNDG